MSISWVVLVGGAAIAILWENDAFGPFIIAGGLLFFMGARSFAKRFAPTSAKEVLEADPRPPVLVLRPFSEDESSALSYVTVNLTFEQSLASVLGGIGPVIAIGRPGEALPPLGGARMYVKNADWQGTVTGLMEKSSAVVILMFTHAVDGKGTPRSGLRWELEKSFSLLDPHRLLLVMPPAAKKMTGGWRQSVLGLRKREASSIASYNLITNHAKLPCRLPELREDVEYITFNKDWNSRVLRSRKRKKNLAAISDALRPFFEGLGKKAQSTSTLVLNFRYNVLYRLSIYTSLWVQSSPCLFGFSNGLVPVRRARRLRRPNKPMKLPARTF